MAIQILMQALGIAGITQVAIEAVEAAVVLVIPPGAEVGVLHRGIELFAGIEQIRSSGRRECRIPPQRHAVGIAGVAVDDLYSIIKEQP